MTGRVDQLDENVVLGLFTWDSVTPTEHHNREIDIEFSKWGKENNNYNAQYVVQPYDQGGCWYKFPMELQGVDSTHSFHWGADSVQFSSFQGHGADPSDEIESRTCNDGTPPEGNGNARINLWLFGGNSPSDGPEVEVIIEAFEFTSQAE